MQICTLVGIFAAMVWPSTLVNVCRYKCSDYSFDYHIRYGGKCKGNWEMTQLDYLGMRAARNDIYLKMLRSEGTSVAPLRQQVELFDDQIKLFLSSNPIDELSD